ncbi:hypothetical protein [Flavobacterium sp. UGB4466]|uniref:hypothetical protein n=1 Tax=Flavobacterium sp. UGB4466 TaxID=2730889 RepID=UPI00192CA0A4|nr:hypothetical protein [Flavobacterium sp. UGB4466]
MAKKLVTFLFLLSFNHYCLSNENIQFEQTTTYQQLLLDSKLYGNNNDEITICRKLTRSALNKIQKKFTNSEMQNATALQVQEIFSMIDSTFTEFNFLYDNDLSDYHFTILTLALREEFSFKYRYTFLNDYRIKYWKDKKDKKCKKIDCDQYCRIYLGITEMLNLPVSIIQIPQHYYLRWNFKNGTHLNWETTTGTLDHKNSNDSDSHVIQYQENYGNNYYPYEIKANEVISNYKTLLADNIFEAKPLISITNARELYASAIKSSYRRPDLYGNFVWLHIMNPELSIYYNFEELKELIDQEIQLEKDVNHYDAKACLYAIKGDFDTALTISNVGLKCLNDKNRKIEKAVIHNSCFKLNKDCRTNR